MNFCFEHFKDFISDEAFNAICQLMNSQAGFQIKYLSVVPDWLSERPISISLKRLFSSVSRYFLIARSQMMFSTQYRFYRNGFVQTKNPGN